jgi:phosphate transport system permease protein
MSGIINSGSKALANDRISKRIKSAIRTDRIMTVVFSLVGGFFLALIIALAAYIIIKGFSGYYPGLLGFDSDGIGNQLFNTVYLVFLSLLIRFIRISIESLSSLPSIVVGLFGYLVFILMTGMRWNLMAGSLAVSILSLPSITTTTEDSLRSLPKSLKSGSMALGATHWVTIVKVLLPACLPRIITGVILAAGRGFGEAAALLYTAGQSTHINWNNFDITSATCPFNPFRPGETLALHIWVMRTEGSLNPNSQEIADFSAAILVIMVLLFSLTARIITARISRKQLGNGKDKK